MSAAWPPRLRLAFGCEQLGGYGWGDVDESEVSSAVLEAIDRGVTLFDTADVYGRGESERRLGQLLKHRSRDSILVATKFGVRFAGDKVIYDSSPEWAEEALHASLSRLATGHVDLYQMHYWDGRTPIEATLDKLEALRGRGLIRRYGTSNYLPDVPSAAYPGLASVSQEFSLVNRRFEADARRCEQKGLAFLSYGSLGQGMLSGKYDAATRFADNDRRAASRYVNFHGERLERNLRIVEVLRAQAALLARPMSQVAIAWILARLPASIPIVGIKRPAQLQDAIQALTIAMPESVMRELDQISSGPEAAGAH